jgi:hypothetical protein
MGEGPSCRDTGSAGVEGSPVTINQPGPFGVRVPEVETLSAFCFFNFL